MTISAKSQPPAAVPGEVNPRTQNGRRTPEGLKEKPGRIHAKAIKRIFGKTTGEHVGWLYKWNTGEVVPRWKSEEHIDVYYE